MNTQGAIPIEDYERSRQVGASSKQRALIQSSRDFIGGFKPPDYLFDGVLQRRYIYSLTAPTGSGKTSFLLLLAAATAQGTPIANRDMERGRVIYFAGENAYRHRKADAEAYKRDRGYFRANPERCFRVRRALPFEGEHWTAETHKRTPWVIVYASPDGKEYRRHAMAGGKVGLPNNEAFLSLLWHEIQKRKEGGETVDFTPERHKELLEMAGCWKGAN